jgi:hypothetical protein
LNNHTPKLDLNHQINTAEFGEINKCVLRLFRQKLKNMKQINKYLTGLTEKAGSSIIINLIVIAYIILTTSFLQNLKAQDSLISRENDRHTYYKARINLFQGQTIKGYLMAIKDSSVFVSEKNIIAKKRNLGPDPFHKSMFTGDTAMDKNNYILGSYNYKLVESIKVTDQKIKTWTIVTGTVVGIVIGAIIGSSNGSDQGFLGLPAGAKGFLVGIIGGGVGALTGLAVASAFEKKYLINGDWKSLEEIKTSLKY